MSGRRRAEESAERRRIREVVRATFALVADLSGASFAARHVEDIATRVAAQLARPALTDEERGHLHSVRLLLRATEASNWRAEIATLDRLLEVKS